MTNEFEHLKDMIRSTYSPELGLVEQLNKQHLGYLIYESPEGKRYADNNKLIQKWDRRCVQCDHFPWYTTGFDYCFGPSGIPGAVWACCGHGLLPGLIRWSLDYSHSTDAILALGSHHHHHIAANDPYLNYNCPDDYDPDNHQLDKYFPPCADSLCPLNR